MTSKIKVGIFIDTFYPMVDGVVVAVDNIATQLSERCDITVFTVGPADKNKKDERNHSFNIVRCKSKSLPFLDYDLPMPGSDKKFKKILKESNLDIVYFHSPMSLAKYAIKYAKKNNVPILSHMHSQYKRDFYRASHSKFLTKVLLKRIMKWYNQSDCAVAVNEFAENLFKEDYGLKCPTKVIYNATDMMPLENIDLIKAEINKKYDLQENEKIFLFVGRLNKLKNITFTIDALKQLNKVFQNFKFLIVGEGKDKKYFEKYIKICDMESKVRFLGKITDHEELKKIYARADLLLFPSKYDTDGIVKIEAAAQKTPTVFIRDTGASSSILDKVNGFISEDSVQDFADTIYNAISDENLYKIVCENSFDQIYRTWENSANEIYDLIIKEIEKKKKSQK